MAKMQCCYRTKLKTISYNLMNNLILQARRQNWIRNPLAYFATFDIKCFSRRKHAGDKICYPFFMENSFMKFLKQ